MQVHDYLSDDGHAILALCSAFGLPPEPEARPAAPFTLAAWNQLAKQIGASPLKSPAALQRLEAAGIAKALGIPEEESKRIELLLGRAGRLALELETLFSRGMWVVTRADELYPKNLRANLKAQSPTVLFGAGDIHLLRKGGVAVIGSRNIDEAGAAFAREVGGRIVAAGLPVISGGARGTDRLAMDAAIQAHGLAVGVLADSLERTVRQPDLRQLLIDGELVMVTPYSPAAGFSVGSAMGRNKVIYGLADYAVVVSSEYQTGGTWAGAVEALKAGSCPVFVRETPSGPKGNRELVKLGAHPLPEHQLAAIENIQDWLKENARRLPTELDLFDAAPASALHDAATRKREPPK